MAKRPPRGWTRKNRAPKDLTISAATVAEDAAVGTTVGTLSATDQDGDDLTFTLTDDAGGAFEIDGTALKVAGALSYAENPTMAVTIRVTDEAGNELDATITITVTAAEGGGLSALMASDFKNGVYTIDGSPSDLASSWTENLDWGAWDPASVVNAQGMVATEPSIAPVVTTPAALVASGATLVANVIFSAGTAASKFAVEFLNLPSYSPEFIADFETAGAGSGQIWAGGADTYPPDYSLGAHRIAVTFTTAGISASVDGGEVMTAAAGEGMISWNSVALTLRNATLEDITFYPPQDDADLPALSAIA